MFLKVVPHLFVALAFFSEIIDELDEALMLHFGGKPVILYGPIERANVLKCV